MFPRVLVATTLVAVATAAFFVGVAVSRPAQAQTPPTVVCASIFKAQKGDVYATDPIARWMNEQAAAGKTNFVTVPTSTNPGMCAW